MCDAAWIFGDRGQRFCIGAVCIFDEIDGIYAVVCVFVFYDAYRDRDVRYDCFGIDSKAWE